MLPGQKKMLKRKNIAVPAEWKRKKRGKLLTNQRTIAIIIKRQIAQNRKDDPLAQLAEQLPFKQWVRSSNLRRVTIKAKQYRCRRPEAYGINCFRAFSARKFDDDSIDANHCFPLTGGIRTPSSQWLANPKPCGALFETATFKKGAIFLPIEYTKFGASICWS